jgi:RNA polymerase sigma-70 factor (ECF subfamily)
MQDTFIVGFRELASLREPAALRSWLAQIAVRLVRRRVRRARLFRLFGFAGGDDDRGLRAQAAPELAPDARAELALLDRALGRLRTEPQIAWTLRRVEGLSLA